MQKAFLLILILLFFFPAFSQITVPPEIKRIQEKMKSGEELTEEEEEKFDQWSENLEKQLDKQVNQKPEARQGYGINVNNTVLCPKKVVLPVIAELTKEKYVLLAKALMETYGAKSGDLPKLNSLLETTKKSTDGADMGALLSIEGAGSASVYTIAWSASRKPDDVLTANNLGVALKDAGEYVKSIQVLKYADKLKPNIGLIQCNLGWAYREAGDFVNAKLFFGKALALAPGMTSPYLGLGLIAKCEGNNLKAEEYLRKALAQRYSAIGIAAYKNARSANQQSNQGGGSPKPLADKGNAGEIYIPGLPVSDNKFKMAQQTEPLQNYVNGLDARIQQLISEMQATLSIIRKQQERALKDPDNAVVFRRDFATEIMQITDVVELLFGENSNYGLAVKQGTVLLEASGKNIEKDLPTMMQLQDKGTRLLNQEIKLLEQLAACGNNEPCQKKIEAEIKAVEYEGELVAHQMCVLQKGQLDVSFSNQYKCYKLVSDALDEAIPDFYAFTNPILERIYSPSFNEYYNLYREALVLNHLKYAGGLACSLSDFSKQFSELKCVEPEPPEPPVEVKKPELTKTNEKECPLGKDGISGGIGALSFELSCTHVKLSGGEGVLWSVKRDFEKHETTIWGGVGVKGEYGKGNITGEATVGVEITIGQGDVIKDAAFTSSVKAGIGGLVEGEVSGRFAMEGGPCIETNANLIKPELPKFGGNSE